MAVHTIKLTDGQEREMLRREMENQGPIQTSHFAQDLMKAALRAAQAAARGLQSLRASGRAAGVDYNEG